MQTRLIFSLYSVVTLKIRSRSLKSNQIFQPSQQYMKFGLNPSFGSRDRVQISFFWSKTENFEVHGDLENEVKVIKI